MTTRPMPAAIMDRFMEKVVMPDDYWDDCWKWTGCLSMQGYGQIASKEIGKQLAHRLAYEHWVGLIPEKFVVDHLCRNRYCVNPAHLEAVTSKENTNRGIHPNSAKTHCKNGHAFSEDNTHHSWQSATGKTIRVCRICRRRNGQTYKARQRERGAA